VMGLVHDVALSVKIHTKYDGPCMNVTTVMQDGFILGVRVDDRDDCDECGDIDARQSYTRCQPSIVFAEAHAKTAI